MLRFARFLLLAVFVFAAGCNRDPIAQSKRLVENGKRFAEKGKHKEASIMFRRALQKDAKNGDAYYQLGLTSLKLEQPVEAMRAFQRAVTTQPDNTDAAVKLGDLLWTFYAARPDGNKGLLTEVQGIRDNLLKKNPKSFDGLRFAGYLALAENNIPEASKNFEAAHAVKPYDPVLTTAYARVLLVSGRAGDAERLLKDTIARNKNYLQGYDQLVGIYLGQKRLPEVEQTLKLASDNNPKSEPALANLAAFYFASQRRPELEATLQKITSNPTDFPKGRLTVGSFFARRRDFDRAQREFEEGVKAHPKEKGLYQKAIAEILSWQGKNSEASQILAQVLKDDPKDSQAIAMRSALRLTSGSQDEVKAALADLQKIVDQNPRNAAYRFQLANAQTRIQPRNYEQAQVHLQEAIRLSPGFTQARALLAQVYAARQDHARALATADEVLKADPRNYQARLVRSGSLVYLGRRDEARKELEELLKNAPNSLDAKYQLGFLSFVEKNYKEAETIFQELHAAAPSDERGLIGVVEAEVAMNNNKNAIALLEAELQRNPKNPRYRTVLGNILVRDGQYDRAIQQYQQASADDKSADLMIRIGETYRLKGDLNNSLEALRRAKTLAGGKDLRPSLRLAMLLDGMGRRTEAKPLYEEVLRIQPDQPIALNNLAFLKAEEGTDLDTAMAYAQRARNNYPQDPNIADTLGWIYIKKNLSDDAIRIYREITTKDPANPLYRYHLAVALFQKGDKQNAKRELEIAMKNGPAPADQQRIKELLVKVGS